MVISSVVRPAFAALSRSLFVGLRCRWAWWAVASTQPLSSTVFTTATVAATMQPQGRRSIHPHSSSGTVSPSISTFSSGIGLSQQVVDVHESEGDGLDEVGVGDPGGCGPAGDAEPGQ